MKDQELFPELYDETQVDPLIKKIFNKELQVPTGFKIDISDGLPYELRNGWNFGQEVFGYYQCSPEALAIAYRKQNGLPKFS